MNDLLQHIEALIFVADNPIRVEEIAAVLEEFFKEKIAVSTIEAQIEVLKQKYEQPDFAFELVEIAGGIQFLTKKKYHETVGILLKQTTKKKLTKSALETLAIIAYRQPITKTEIEQLRGVNCDYAVQKLLEKELITISGRSEKAGRPLLYATSPKFMDYFGIKSLNDLPKIKDFKDGNEGSEIGERTE